MRNLKTCEKTDKTDHHSTRKGKLRNKLERKRRYKISIGWPQSATVSLKREKRYDENCSRVNTTLVRCME